MGICIEMISITTITYHSQKKMKPSALYTIITIQVFLQRTKLREQFFYQDEKGDVFHTYSTYARGGEQQLSAYILPRLDTWGPQ